MRRRRSCRSARAPLRARASQPASTRRARFEALEDRCLLAVGAELVKVIRVGTGSSSPGSLTDVNGTLYFQAGGEAKLRVHFGGSGTRSLSGAAFKHVE